MYFVIVETNLQEVWHVDKSTYNNLIAYINVVFSATIFLTWLYILIF